MTRIAVSDGPMGVASRSAWTAGSVVWLLALASSACSGISSSHTARGPAGRIAGRPPASFDCGTSAGCMARGHVQHVVVIVQENRTFDNIFGGSKDGNPASFPGADAFFDEEIAPLMQAAPFSAPDQPAPTTKEPGPGCFASSTASVTVPSLGADGYIENVTRGREGQCYENTTLADLLEAQHRTWTNYVTMESQGGQWVRSDVFDGFINIQNWYQETTSWRTSMFDLENDIKGMALKDVTWVKPPCVQLSDHPQVSLDASASWVASVVNWIGQSPAWNDTVIFVIWDDWGGFYDHVVPPSTRPDRLGPGVRIPFLLISPFGPNGSVVHAKADYGSILKFIEDLWDLGRLNQVDGDAPDLLPFFDFSQQRPFVQVSEQYPFTPSLCPTDPVDKSLIDP